MSSDGTSWRTLDVWAVVASERRALADQLAALTPDQWSCPSLCQGWTVRHVAAHLTAPVTVSMPRMALAVLRARGHFDRANDAVTQQVAGMPTSQIVTELRRAADSRFTPPGAGPAAPLTDVLVHGQDIRLPLGLLSRTSSPGWGLALEHAAAPRGRRGRSAGHLPAVRLVAGDLDDAAFGTGPEVRGTAADLTLAVLGRRARLEALSGPGAGQLRAWALGEHTT